MFGKAETCRLIGCVADAAVRLRGCDAEKTPEIARKRVFDLINKLNTHFLRPHTL